MRSRCGALAMRVALAVQLVWLASARAEGVDSSSGAVVLPITLELQSCDALDRVELVKLLAIEFRTLGVLRTTPREHVHVECAEQRARVTLESGRSSNEVDLGATAPAVWPRLLALSVSEIVIESRARVAPATPSLRASPRPVEAPAIQAQDADFRVFVGAAVRRAVRPSTWLSGPEVGFLLELNRHVDLDADLRFELGHTDTALAKVDWASASGAIVALVGGSVGRWSFGVGPGVRVGYLRLSPQVRVVGATGHAVSGLWAGPELEARARYDLAPRWFALGGVDSGIVTTAVTGLVNGEQRLVDTGGGWVSVVLGAGTVF